MKKILTSIAAIGCVALASTAAHAGDGLVQFTGTVTEQSCTATVNGSDTAVVQLDPVAAGELSASGVTAKPKKFTINVTGCAATPNQVVAIFTSNAYDANSGTLQNTAAATPATNVNLQLLDSTSRPIKVSGDSADALQKQGQSALISGGQANIDYYVEYYATGPAVAGQVAAEAEFTLAYP